MARDVALSWRPIERGDVEGWADLIAAVQVADHDREYYGVEDLLDLFRDPYRDFPRGSVGVFDGTAMVGYGTLMSRSAVDPVHQMRYWGAVHPAHRGRGLGGRLLDWAESAAVPLHRDRYPGRPLALSTYALRPVPVSLMQRECIPIAGQGDLSAPLLGFVIAHEYEGVTKATGNRDAYIALVGTGREARKRGVAFALLSRVLTAARAAGCVTASLGVDADSPTGALGLYQRAGFAVRHTSTTYLKPLTG